MKRDDIKIAHLRKIIKEAVKDALDELRQDENDGEPFKIEDYWDLNSYSEEQIKSICTDLSVFIYGNNFGEPMQIVNGKLKIYESTTEYTLPYKDVKKELQKDFQFQDW